MRIYFNRSSKCEDEEDSVGPIHDAERLHTQLKDSGASKAVLRMSRAKIRSARKAVKEATEAKRAMRDLAGKKVPNEDEEDGFRNKPSFGDVRNVARRHLNGEGVNADGIVSIGPGGVEKKFRFEDTDLKRAHKEYVDKNRGSKLIRPKFHHIDDMLKQASRNKLSSIANTIPPELRTKKAVLEQIGFNKGWALMTPENKRIERSIQRNGYNKLARARKARKGKK